MMREREERKSGFLRKCIPNHARIEGKKNRKRTKREAMGKRLPPTNFIRGQRRKAKNVEPVGSIQRNSLSHSSPHSDSFSSSSLSLSDRDPRMEEEREGKIYIETDWRPANGNENGVQTPVVVGPANGNHG